MQNQRHYLFLILIFLSIGCGHTQLVLDDEDANTSLGQSAKNKSNTPALSVQVTPSQPGDPCTGFAIAVTSFNPGANAGFGQETFPNIVLGPPKGEGKLNGSVDVLSLGIEGEIILDLGDCHLIDGEGIDFLVFENSFFVGGISTNPFEELAVVGVSLDGEDFVEFECSDAVYPYTGCAGWHPVYSNPNNTISPFDVGAAGGDPFDLAEIGVTETKYIRIREVRGAMDPVKYGFDLDAIAIIHGEQQ